MLEDFINAIKSFRINKTRTILSLLGIIIGVASVIMVTTIGKSATESVKSSFGSSGLDIVQIMGGYDSTTKTIAFDERFRNELATQIPEIRRLCLTNDLGGQLSRTSLNMDLTIKAIELGYLDAMAYTLDYGSSFGISEIIEGEQRIILGYEVARYLFPEGSAVGKTVILHQNGAGFGFRVIGVLKKAANNGFENPDRLAYIPRAFYHLKISPDPIATSIVAQAKAEHLAPVVQKKIEALALRLTKNPNSVYVFSMQTILEQYDKITRSLNLLLSGIAGISLLVGGIGIMNIMIVTVTERKKEIGIRKALGASPRAIRNQFLVESATTTLLGGIAGIFLGLILSYVIVGMFKWPFIVQWTNCAAAFFFSAFIGIFFGLSPALRAAKLDPIKALASE